MQTTSTRSLVSLIDHTTATMQLSTVLTKDPAKRTDADDDLLSSYCRRLEYFQTFSPEALHAIIVPSLQYRRLRINEILIGEKDLKEKEYTGPVYVVLSGIIEMRIMTPSSRFAIEMLKGDVVGEPHMLRNLPGATYYVTKDVAEVLVIPYEAMASFNEGLAAKDLEQRVAFLQSAF